MEDTELRTRLELLAYRTAPPPRDADELIATVVASHRARRLRQWVLTAAVAVVATVLVLVPAARSALDRDPTPAAPSTSTGVYTTPTRGNLADDVVFLEAMRRQPWTSGPAGDDVTEPPLDTRRVVFASDTTGERWVLVAGADPDALPPDEGVDPVDLDELGSVAIAWFTGPLGGAPEEMRVYGEPRIVDADEPTAVLSPTEPYGSPSQALAIVVGAPGDQLESSGIRFVEPDGDITREFDGNDMVDGVHVSPAGQVDASINRSDRHRVVRGGTEFTVVPETEPRPDFVPPQVDLARLRPAPPPAPGDAAVASAIDELLSHTGLWAHILPYTVLWAGDLPNADGDGARLTVLAAEFDEGGAVYLTGALGWESGGQVISGPCGSEIRPAGTPLEDLVVVLRCGPEESSTDSLVVVAPPGAKTARALDERGAPIASYPLVDGVAVVPVPPNLASVAVIAADGETVDERPPMGEVDFGD